MKKIKRLPINKQLDRYAGVIGIVKKIIYNNRKKINELVDTINEMNKDKLT
jgi:hypothetical protein